MRASARQCLQGFGAGLALSSLISAWYIVGFKAGAASGGVECQLEQALHR